MFKQGKWPDLVDEIRAKSQRIQYLPGTGVPTDIRYTIAEVRGWGQWSDFLPLDQLDTALQISDYFEQYFGNSEVYIRQEWHNTVLFIFSCLLEHFCVIETILNNSYKSEEQKKLEVSLIFARILSDMSESFFYSLAISGAEHRKPEIGNSNTEIVYTASDQDLMELDMTLRKVVGVNDVPLLPPPSLIGEDE